MDTDLSKINNLSQYLDLPKITGRLGEKLGLEECKKFKAALSSAVSTNPVLAKECIPDSVINAALIGHSLNLPPSPQLGYYYLVPYNNKKKRCKEAQFQMGYKGYIQLAMRSGYYKRLNVITIKEGEFVSWNPLLEDLSLSFIEDPIEREKAKTIGYCGCFEYLNGFKKLVFWTKESMEVHADKYSPAYSLASDKLLKADKIPQDKLWKYSSFWYADFDAMGMKTVLRQMLSKWGSMSVDMQVAYEHDLEADNATYSQVKELNEAAVDDKTKSEVIEADVLKTKTETPAPDVNEDWEND